MRGNVEREIFVIVVAVVVAVSITIAVTGRLLQAITIIITYRG